MLTVVPFAGVVIVIDSSASSTTFSVIAVSLMIISPSISIGGSLDNIEMLDMVILSFSASKRQAVRVAEGLLNLFFANVSFTSCDCLQRREGMKELMLSSGLGDRCNLIFRRSFLLP